MSTLIPASLFTDHIVLQRDQTNPVWGTDRPGQVVQVILESAAGTHQVSATAGRDGRWSADLPPLPAGGPHTLRLVGTREVALKDVWVGEVWVASGQSNMEWTVGQARQSALETATANWPMIRTFQVGRVPATSPVTHADGRWQPVCPQTVGAMTAVGYFFAREIHLRLGVAVGIINASWGGTRVEAWASEEALRPLLDFEAEARLYDPDHPDLAATRLAHEKLSAAWEMEHLPADPGNTGLGQGWADPGFDDRNWREMDLPAMWQSQGLSFNGVVWFRRTVEIPPSWAGHPLRLSLGMVDDFDQTYANGVEVGSHPKGTPDAYRRLRDYPIPPELTARGKLTVAVRVFDHFGFGGFAGPASALRVTNPALEGEAVSQVDLRGPWKYSVEHALPPVSSAVFVNYPRPPALPQPHNAPAALFNGMINPLTPYGMRGVIWYQGESNAEQHACYRDRFAAMIADWRSRFRKPDLAFHFVQLANYIGSPAWPFLREAQAQVLALPNTGMATAIDLGQADDIHPINKQEVGRRLALLALKRNYQIEGTVDAGPQFSSFELRPGAVVVSFETPARLCTSDHDHRVKGFELAGEDGVYHTAEGSLEGNQVMVRSAAVPHPVSVRYAWASNPVANLSHLQGLPALPFRTDH